MRDPSILIPILTGKHAAKTSASARIMALPAGLNAYASSKATKRDMNTDALRSAWAHDAITSEFWCCTYSISSNLPVIFFSLSFRFRDLRALLAVGLLAVGAVGLLVVKGRAPQVLL